MTRFLALAALVAACSSPAHSADTVTTATPARAPAPPADAASVADAGGDAGALIDAAPAKKLGAHGAVCRIGERHRQAGGGAAPIECGAGLHCCYPCGI